jgi:hypothetical protein
MPLLSQNYQNRPSLDPLPTYEPIPPPREIYSQSVRKRVRSKMPVAFQSFPTDSLPSQSSLPKLAKIHLALSKDQLQSLFDWATAGRDNTVKCSKGDLIVAFVAACLNQCYDIPVSTFSTVVNVSSTSLCSLLILTVSKYFIVPQCLCRYRRPSGCRERAYEGNEFGSAILNHLGYG